MKTITEGKRGCGYRKPGGFYITCEMPVFPCDKLPIPLTVCPCCGEGIKHTRAYQFVGYQLLDRPCMKPGCLGCYPFNESYRDSVGEYMLLWIGAQFYPTPDDFMKEGMELGLSRRLPISRYTDKDGNKRVTIPSKLKIGETFILLAHIKAIRKLGGVAEDESTIDFKPIFTPGIFGAMLCQEIQYVVKEDDTPEFIAYLEEIGVTPVNVVYKYKQLDITEEMEEEGGIE